mgnify:CR=1 FL=1
MPTSARWNGVGGMRVTSRRGCVSGRAVEIGTRGRSEVEGRGDRVGADEADWNGQDRHEALIMARGARSEAEAIGSSQGEMLLYQGEGGRIKVECRFVDGSVWLPQKLIGTLYQKDVRTINEHLRNIYAEGELDRGATIRKFRIVRQEGTREVAREIEHYNLDAILAVGYRVRSQRGTRFRQWATAQLSEFLLKGFLLNDERLKNPPGPGVPDYFDEMLERIRDIRAAEKRMYLQVRNILALAADYEPDDEETQLFFQTVQNKLHFAVTGKTAAEIIAERADSRQPHMGLTVWKGEVVRKGDVTIAKNYLHEPEITELNRIVAMFLDFAEDQARRRRQVFMRDWRERLDAFLQLSDREVLDPAGGISRAEAADIAHEQYQRFHTQRLEAQERQAAEQSIRDLEQAVRTLDIEQQATDGREDSE